MNKSIIKIGLWSALLCLSAFIVWIISFVGIAVSSPLFYWSDLEHYIEFTNNNNQFFQYLAKSFMIVFSLAFMVLIIVFQEFTDASKKILGKIAVAFSVLFAMVSSMHYFVQISAVRFAHASEEFSGIEHFLQAKPTSFLSSVNMLGWTIFLGLSTLFMYFALIPNALTKAVRIGLIINAVSCLLAGFGYLFQIDLITFIFVNLGLGGAVMIITISALNHFLKLNKT